MSGIKAQCSSCNHRWTTRKPPDEIERPRCAECDAGEESITFGIDSSPEAIESSDSSALTRAKRWSKRQTLLDRIEGQLNRIDATAPPETDETVAYELRESYHEVSALKAELRRTDDLALEELEEIEAYLESVIESINEHADELERQDQISDRIDELDARRESLKNEIDELAERKVVLKTELETINIQLRDVESEAAAFEKGRMTGRENWQITYSCSRCNDPIAVKPGSHTHNAVTRFLRQNHWGHVECNC